MINTKLLQNREKILNIIASCQNTTHLMVVSEWLDRMEKDDWDNAKSGLMMAIHCRYYQLVQEFNTLKALSRNQSIEEYTEGKQKFYVEKIRRLYERANT